MKNTLLDNRYQLQKPIGQGGFATVWLATDTRLRRPVAVKLLDPLLVQKQGKSIIEQFFQEGQAMAQLSHAHIVQIYDWGEQGSYLYIVMEYMPGGDLAQKLKQSQPAHFTLPTVLKFLTPIAQALETAHAQQLIHRDVKPQNILFAADGRPVLTDFGLVKFLSKTLYVNQYSHSRILGTPEYMASEQARGQPTSPQTDVYALTVIAYELLVGRVPFQGNTPFSTGIIALTRPRTELSWPKTLNPKVIKTLQSGLAITPADRPATPLALIETLDKAMQSSQRTIQTKTSVSDPTTSQQPKKPIVQKTTKTPSQPTKSQTLPAKDKPARPANDKTPNQPAKSQTPPNENQPVHQESDKPTIPPDDVKLPYITQDKTPLAFTWCWVPPGPFRMGSAVGDDNAKPVHEVLVDGFWLSRYPVTNQQYRLFIEGKGYQTEKWWTPNGWAWLQKKPVKEPQFWREPGWNDPNSPVVGVSWYEALAFTQWAAGSTGFEIHLPTEAEWEKGARGIDERPYPWGTSTPSTNLGNFNGHIGRTTPVGRYSPQGDSPYGATDMVGNVWEWCQTRYQPYTFATYEKSQDTTISGARVLRGLTWHSKLDAVHAATRRKDNPDQFSAEFGFRVVRRFTPQGHIANKLGRRETGSQTRQENNKLVAPSADVKLPHIVLDKTPLAFTWCWVPPGPFRMGSDEGNDNEKPVHEVMVDGFWLSRYPVTNQQYRAFVEEVDGYSREQWWTPAGWAWLKNEKIKEPKQWRETRWNKPNLPVVGVSWYEAFAFTQWATHFTGLEIRLPTEAEWEKGARGTDERPYPWGAEPPSVNRCNFATNVGSTTPVGLYSHQGDSPYGAADMAGNVWEWCQTIYKPYPYAAYEANQPTADGSRGLRGGSWNFDQYYARAAYRNFGLPNYRNLDLGFRVVVVCPPISSP